MRRFVPVLVLSAACAWVGAAEAQVESRPGYFPLERFEILSSDELSLEINLSGSLLDLVAAAVEAEDPEFARLVRGLEGIRVRLAETDELDLARLRTRLAEARGWLEANRWETLLRLREEDEEIYLYTRTDGDDMVGVALLALERSEVVLVNVVGRLDLSLLGALGASLDIPQLDVLRQGGATADEGED